jgi:transcriptional regulator with XRE-family HTH domain
MSLGFNIRMARLKAQLSQEELARRADVNRTYLSQLENDRSSPTFAVLEKIAAALEVQTAELMAEPRSAREPIPHYQDAETPNYPGLQEFLTDERIRLLMNPTPEEIEILKGIRFLNRFSPSKDLFVEVLLDYRRSRESRESSLSPEN